MIARLQIVAQQPLSIFTNLKQEIIKENTNVCIFSISMCIFYGIYKIYMCKLNDNSKCDIWLESPISLNHEWKIGGYAGNCNLA